MQNQPFIIALEEHYFDAEIASHFLGRDVPPEIRKRLDDLGELRIKEMDEAGINVQVLSQGAPALQRVDAVTAVPLAVRANDRLKATIDAHPDRFAGFAVLPTADPQAAANELERCVTKLGFKGAMIHGLTNGVFFDDKRFWPICERAQALDVPLYLHPAMPHPAVIEAYYKDYAKDFPTILNAGWGFTVETATQGLRMVLSGVFDAYPRLKIILGHLGEGLPRELAAWEAPLDEGFNPCDSERHDFVGSPLCCRHSRRAEHDSANHRRDWPHGIAALQLAEGAQSPCASLCALGRKGGRVPELFEV